MVANSSRRHIQKVFNRVRNGIRRRAMKKHAKKVKRRRTTINALLMKLTRETIINAARMEDFDAAMNRQRAVWLQEPGAQLIQYNNTHGSTGQPADDQMADENTVPASASIIRRFFKLPGAKRGLATELFSRLLTDLENEQNEQWSG